MVRLGSCIVNQFRKRPSSDISARESKEESHWIRKTATVSVELKFEI